MAAIFSPKGSKIESSKMSLQEATPFPFEPSGRVALARYFLMQVSWVKCQLTPWNLAENNVLVGRGSFPIQILLLLVEPNAPSGFQVPLSYRREMPGHGITCRIRHLRLGIHLV